MWGMSQLKDSLDVSHQRQLELLKENNVIIIIS